MRKLKRVNEPGTLIPITVVSETELAGEDRLRNIALDLENLRTTLRFTVELKNESRIRLSLHIQMKLRGGAFSLLPNRNPAIVEHRSLSHRSGKVYRNRHFPKQSPGADAASGASPAGVDRDFEAELLG